MDNRQYRVMGASEILDRTFFIFKNNFWKNTGYILLYKIVSMVFISTAIFIGVFPLLIGGILSSTAGGINAPSIGLIIVGGIILFVVYLLIVGVVMGEQGGIVQTTSKGFLNQPIQVIDTFGKAILQIPKILTVLIAIILVYIPIFLGFGVGISGIGYALYKINNWDWNIPTILGITAITILSIAMISLFIFIGVRFMFGIQVAVLENKLFFSALKRSSELVKGYFWKIFGVVIIWWLIIATISYTITMLLMAGVGVMQSYFIMEGFEEEVAVMGIMLIYVIQFGLQLIFSLTLTPLLNILNTLLYYNQRIRKEGLHIELALEKLEAEQKEETGFESY